MNIGPDKSLFSNPRHLYGFIHEINLMMTRDFERDIKQFGISRPQAQVLSFLHRHDGQAQTAIANFLGVAKAPLGHTIDIMEKNGWVERRNDPVDRRVHKIFLTAKVQQILPQLFAFQDKLTRKATRGFSKNDAEALNRLIANVHENLLAATQEDQQDS